MKKIFYTSAILGTAALSLIGCASTAPTANNIATTANSNTAVVINSNANTASNSNAVSNAGSNANSNASSGKKPVASSDQAFAEKALQGGLAEVQMGGLATTKGKNFEVTAFGQKMVTDHSKANTELRDIAGSRGITLPGGVSDEQRAGLDKLQKLEGAAFDKEYVKMMVADHAKDVAEFQQEADTGVDAELKSFAAETLPTLKMHLEMIKALSAKMK